MKTVDRKYPFHFNKQDHKEFKPATEDVFYESESGQVYSQFYKGQLLPVSVWEEVFGSGKSSKKSSSGDAMKANEPYFGYIGDRQVEVAERGKESDSDSVSEEVKAEEASISDEVEAEEKPKARRHKSIIKKEE